MCQILVIPARLSSCYYIIIYCLQFGNTFLLLAMPLIAQEMGLDLYLQDPLNFFFFFFIFQEQAAHIPS
jgi:hypothetical protein